MRRPASRPRRGERYARRALSPASETQEHDAAMRKHRLPLGIQAFRTLRQGECYYVDKTAHLWRMVNEGKHYFLSPPRRFGKSLHAAIREVRVPGSAVQTPARHAGRRDRYPPVANCCNARIAQ